MRYVGRMKLLEHLRTLHESPHHWAKRHEIPKDAVYRHLGGKSIDYDNAKRISEATAGAVSVAEIMG